MPEKQILVLVGFIASGKSTLCRRLAGEGWIVMCDDSIVTAVHGGRYELYDRSNVALYKSTENHIACMALALGKPVVIDRGVNGTVSSRRRWLGIAKSLDVPCRALVMPMASPQEHARRRALSDPRGRTHQWWIDVASRHAVEFQMPTLAEGFDSVDAYHPEEGP